MTKSVKSAPADKVPSALAACSRFCREKIGWHRIGFVLSLTIIAVALWVLYRILHDLDVNEVVSAIQATSLQDILLAALFVAAGYFTLTFYDLFALRTIGRNDVPYRAAALAGFTSYSIGHNVGASVFTGGAVRYRIYSNWGLDAGEVAKICFIAGLTFWLGNATVLGLGIAYAPEAASAIDQLPPWANRVMALLVLAVLTSYVIWVWRQPRAIGRGQWQVTLPGGPLTLLQIAIGIVDLACCALAMYMLVPSEPHVSFVTLRGDLCFGDTAGIRQPFSGRAGRFRRRHAGRVVAVRQGGAAGGPAALSLAVLHRSFCAFSCHPRRPRIASVQAATGARRRQSAAIRA